MISPLQDSFPNTRTKCTFCFHNDNNVRCLGYLCVQYDQPHNHERSDWADHIHDRSQWLLSLVYLRMKEEMQHLLRPEIHVFHSGTGSKNMNRFREPGHEGTRQGSASHATKQLFQTSQVRQVYIHSFAVTEIASDELFVSAESV